MANKVKFGLSDVHIAPITYGADNTVTYGTIFELPGAVNLSLDAAGESADFYADNTKYFSDAANQGYTGTLEIALINDNFREKILGQLKDSNGAFIENAGDTLKDFALGCQFEGNSKGTRYWLDFDIDVPKDAKDSDFNSLILRLYKLKYDILNDNGSTFFVKDYNRNIKEMQNTLENFIIKEYSNNGN